MAYDVMREDPTIVRSVTLEDPLSPSVDPNMNSTNSLIAALSAYQSFCDRDPSCAKAFPNLEQEMTSDYTELEQHPGTVDVTAAGEKHPIPIQIDGDRVDIALDAALGSGILAPVASQIYQPSLDIGGLAISEIELGFGSGMPTFGALESEYCKDQFPNDDANDILSDEAADAASPPSPDSKLTNSIETNVELGASPRINQSTFDRSAAPFPPLSPQAAS